MIKNLEEAKSQKNYLNLLQCVLSYIFFLFSHFLKKAHVKEIIVTAAIYRIHDSCANLLCCTNLFIE